MLLNYKASTFSCSVSEKDHVNIAIHSENSCIPQSHFRVSVQSGNTPNTMKNSSSDLATTASQAFTAVATLSGELLLMMALQGEDVYMVMGPKKSADSSNEPQFEDLLMHLAMSGKILVSSCNVLIKS